MVQRFGSREICDVTFKALTSNQKVGDKTFNAGEVVFVIDTAQTSNMEQASTTVYAQGGQGYNRLIAWEGEKTMTFTVTDALMSPMGLAVLTGAGLADNKETHVHASMDVELGEGGKGTITNDELENELGIKVDAAGTTVKICDDPRTAPQALLIDNNGFVTGKAGTVTLKTEDTGIAVTCVDAEDKAVKVDFYLIVKNDDKKVTHITVGPNDFGGYFYVEADTLYRNQDGEDMAATITFPKVKIQSGFTITMAANGDPSTFDFVMDAFPAYTFFDRAHKVVCDFTIVSKSTTGESYSHEEHSF